MASQSVIKKINNQNCKIKHRKGRQKKTLYINIFFYLSDTVPVDCYIFCQQTICEFNNNGVSFFGQDCWAGALSIDGNNHLLEAIRRLVLILHLPFIPSDSSLCYLKNQYWKEKNKQSQKSHHTHLQRSLENLRIWDRLWNVELLRIVGMDCMLVLIPQMFVSYLCNHTLCPVNLRTLQDLLKRNNIVIPKIVDFKAHFLHSILATKYKKTKCFTWKLFVWKLKNIKKKILNNSNKKKSKNEYANWDG